MLEDQHLLRIPLPHFNNKLTEELEVGFMCLTTGVYELNLFAAVSTDANGACEVVGQVLLVPLGSQRNKNRITSMRSPLLA